MRTITTQSDSIRPNIDGRVTGFTLIELVLVMAIVAIVMSYATIRVQSPGEYTGRYQADRLAAALRHVQQWAGAWGVSLRFNTNASSYWVTCVNGIGSAPCVNAGDVITEPGSNQSFDVTLDDGVGLSASPAASFDFDSLGRPHSAGGGLITANEQIQKRTPPLR